MKRIIFTVIQLFSLAVLAGSPNRISTLKPVQLKTYTTGQSNSILLKTDFGNSIIINPKELLKIGNQPIYQVDLIYTKYKSEDSFNQQKLNRERVNSLLKLSPLFNNPAISWNLIEQTAQVKLDDAQNTNHGFIIHYGTDLSYKSLRSFFKPFQKPFESYEVNNSEESNFIYKSGTAINVPADAVTYKNGEPVTGSYQLKYREFRNPAEITFSGIPMVYNEQGEDHNFSSVGMLEVRAEKDGEELKLKKEISYDFNCTHQKPGVNYYEMKDSTGKWEELKKITPVVKKEKPAGTMDRVEIEELDMFRIDHKNPIETYAREHTYHNGFTGETFKFNYSKNRKVYKLRLDQKGLAFFNKNRKMEIDFEELSKHEFKTDSANFFKMMKVFNIPKNHIEPEIATVAEQELNWEKQRVQFRKNQAKRNKDRRNGSLLAEGSSDPGHTYPKVVKGLVSSKFGVYNCDQIYRLESAVTLMPEYINESTGKKISNKHVTCVIDMKYNGSFSFGPNSVTCDAKAKNVILLFTKDKKIFALSASNFKNLNVNESGSIEFKMKEITAEVKNPADLKSFLKNS